ncbi:hypothetical protein EHS25_008096 [Saitozyma podzolica]|uniref:Uncharacterized protein n=1 Tax=Saitozyma podzolica TaxID=1890683 RepID=A0A427YNL4_9TREE|nr:hypothetical protein EHS25_008096 [Saitozyma podzolica]
MEALSRREENDVQEAARNEAMKACDPSVREQMTLMAAYLRLRRLLFRADVHHAIRLSEPDEGDAQVHARVHDRGKNGLDEARLYCESEREGQAGGRGVERAEDESSPQALRQEGGGDGVRLMIRDGT